MKKFNCTADGNPTYTPRHWYDPWCLMVEMIFHVAGAVVFLVIDLYDRSIEEKDTAAVIIEFAERLHLAYTTVPYYLKHIKER